jgi:hypothetical protein
MSEGVAVVTVVPLAGGKPIGCEEVYDESDSYPPEGDGTDPTGDVNVFGCGGFEARYESVKGPPFSSNYTANHNRKMSLPSGASSSGLSLFAVTPIAATVSAQPRYVKVLELGSAWGWVQSSAYCRHGAEGGRAWRRADRLPRRCSVY